MSDLSHFQDADGGSRYSPLANPWDNPDEPEEDQGAELCDECNYALVNCVCGQQPAAFPTSAELDYDDDDQISKPERAA